MTTTYNANVFQIVTWQVSMRLWNLKQHATNTYKHLLWELPLPQNDRTIIFPLMEDGSNRWAHQQFPRWHQNTALELIGSPPHRLLTCLCALKASKAFHALESDLWALFYRLPKASLMFVARQGLAQSFGEVKVSAKWTGKGNRCVTLNKR